MTWAPWTGPLARRTSRTDAARGERDGEVDARLGALDEERDGGPGAGDDAAEGAVLHPGGEHLAEVGAQARRAASWRSLTSCGASSWGSPGAQGGHERRGGDAGRGRRCPRAAGRTRRTRRASTGRPRRARGPSGSVPRARTGASSSPRPVPIAVPAGDEERDVAAELGAELLELLAVQAEVPEVVERDEGGGRVGRAAGHPARDGDALADRDVHGVAVVALGDEPGGAQGDVVVVGGDAVGERAGHGDPPVVGLTDGDVVVEAQRPGRRSRASGSRRVGAARRGARG